MNKYKITCINEGVEYVHTEPCCRKNADHTIRCETISTTTVLSIKEETGGETNGRYACRGEVFTAAPGASSHEISANYKTSILSFTLQATTDMIGDKFTYMLGENTVIGVATATITGTVIPYTGAAYVGLYIGDAKIIAVSPTNFTTDIAISVVAGDLIRATRQMIEHYYIAMAGFHKIGFAKIGGGVLPENTVGKLAYTNAGMINKTVAYSIEYFY